MEDWKKFLRENMRLTLLAHFVSLVAVMTMVNVMILIWVPQYILIISLFTIPICVIWLYAIRRLRYFQKVQLPLGLDHLQPLDPPAENPAQEG